MEPAAKKAKTDGEEKAAEEDPKAEEEQKEPEPPKELEEDAKVDKGLKIKDAVTFHTEETTMNCLPSTCGSMLVPLTDGGLQYLLAGARASVGIKSGRYMFEVRIVEVMNPAEDPAARQRAPLPRSQLRIGCSVAGSSLFLGETEESVCFDTEGAFVHNKKREVVSHMCGGGDTLAVVLNLDSGSPNSGTVSLFKNGLRACQPQALPAAMKGKALFPALTFKNMIVHYNFGPAPLTPLPFTCRMVREASVKDASVTPPAEKPKDGKYEVLFPVCLPDEGTFDWLDQFLEKNKQYTELSDRAILAWAEKSGLSRPKGAGGKGEHSGGAATELAGQKSSNDKPEMGFGISMMDDGSVRRVLHAVAPIQNRNYVVMEVKSNLLKDERKELLAKWAASGFKRTASVMAGEAPLAMKKRSQELALKAKQEASDAEFRAKKAEEARKKLAEKRKKQMEKAKKKAEAAAKKKQEEAEKAAKAESGEGEEGAAEEGKAEEEPAEEEEMEVEEKEEPEEKPPKVELTAEEKKMSFRKKPVPDLSAYALSTSFTKFSIPEKDDGFDEIRYEWSKADRCKEYLKQWVRDRKLTTRVEDLQPSEWFTGQWKAWQKTVQAWHSKQNQYKAAMAKKASDAAAKEAAKKKAAAKAAAAAKAKELKEKEEAEKKEKGEEEATEEGEGAAAEAKEDVPMEPAEEKEEKEEDEKPEEPAVDFEKLDVFGVEDVLDIGGGQPLFSAFNHEDWTMMSLRYELHLLTHAFRRDVNDPDRAGMHVDHLPFYYSKYFKKAFNIKFYGVETIAELVQHVRDSVVINSKNQVVEPQLPGDMESNSVFAMLTEECRRDRLRRIDLGDESAKLKLTTPQVATSPAMAGARPGMTAAVPARPATVRPPPAMWQRPPGQGFANGAQGGFRPPVAFMHQQRPYQGGWRGFSGW